VPLPIRTDRLVLRALRPEDVDAFVAYRADPDVARYQSWSDYTFERGEAFVGWLQGATPGVPGEWFQFALEERSEPLKTRLPGDTSSEPHTDLGPDEATNLQKPETVQNSGKLNRR